MRNICRFDWRLPMVCAAVVLTLVIAIPSGLFAQQNQATSVTGRVTDNQGAVVANADVTVAQWTPAMPGMKMAQGPQFTAKTAANGTFTVTQVPAGQYVLQVD